MNIFSDRVINSIKTALACLVGLFIAHFLSLPMTQWMLITIIVVMAAQTNLGGALQKAYARVIGTLSGAAISMISLILFKHHPLMLDAMMLFSTLGFSYLAAGTGNMAMGGTLGAGTVVMILMNPAPTLEIALFRTLEIIIGILVALFVTRYFFPIHATLRLKTNLAEGVEILKMLYVETTQKYPENHKSFISQPLEEKILAVFLTQRKLLSEAKSEHYPHLKKSALYEVMRHERRFYRSILMLNYSLHGNAQDADLIQALPEYQVFNAEVKARLDALSKGLKEHTQPKNLYAKIDPQVLITAVEKAAAGQLTAVILYAHAFCIGVQSLSEELNELSTMVSGLVV